MFFSFRQELLSLEGAPGAPGAPDPMPPADAVKVEAATGRHRRWAKLWQAESVL